MHCWVGKEEGKIWEELRKGRWMWSYQVVWHFEITNNIKIIKKTYWPVSHCLAGCNLHAARTFPSYLDIYFHWNSQVISSSHKMDWKSIFHIFLIKYRLVHENKVIQTNHWWERRIEKDKEYCTPWFSFSESLFIH